MALGVTASDPVVLAVALLGGLVLLRAAITHVVTTVARGTGAVASAASRAARALRPGVARRLVAASLGLGAPAVALLPTTAATAAPTGVDGGVAAAQSNPTEGVRPAVAAPPQDVGAVYVVRRGDTLWGIARRHLPAAASPSQVARAWPRWYAANRGVIGADPSLIVPGQHLQVPGRRSAGTPTQPHAVPAPSTGTSVPSALSLDPDRR